MRIARDCGRRVRSFLHQRSTDELQQRIDGGNIGGRPPTKRPTTKQPNQLDRASTVTSGFCRQTTTAAAAAARRRKRRPYRHRVLRSSIARSSSYRAYRSPLSICPGHFHVEQQIKQSRHCEPTCRSSLSQMLITARPPLASTGLLTCRRRRAHLQVGHRKSF